MLHISSAHGNDSPTCGVPELPCLSINFTVINHASPGDTITLYGLFKLTNVISVDKGLIFVGNSEKTKVTSDPSGKIIPNKTFLVVNISSAPIYIEIRNITFENVNMASLIRGGLKIVDCIFKNSSINTPVANSTLTVEIERNKFVRSTLIFQQPVFLSLKIATCAFEGSQTDMSFYRPAIDVFTRSGSNTTIDITDSIFKFYFHTLKFISEKANEFVATITNGTFANNKIKWKLTRLSPGGAVFGNGVTLFVLNSLFINNEAKRTGGAIFMENSILSAKNTSFTGNTIWTEIGDAKNSAGGAVGLTSSRALFTKCVFQNNAAKGWPHASSYYSYGSGGAAHLSSVRQNGYDGSSYTFSNCKFLNNDAGKYGGSVYSSSQLMLHKCVFEPPYSSNSMNGAVLYLTGDTLLENVKILPFKGFYKNSLVVFNRKWGIMRFRYGAPSQVICNAGWNPKVINFVTSDTWIDANPISMEIKCISCSDGLYSLQHGSTKIGRLESVSKKFELSKVVCRKCPFGAKCSSGTVKAEANFWGFQKNKDEMQYLTCPQLYCSPSSGTNDSICSQGRTGQLCGHCKNGLTEDLFSTRCTSFENCRKTWMWAVVILSGIVYVLFFMYQTEVENITSKLLGLPQIKKAPCCLRHEPSKNVDYILFEETTIGYSEKRKETIWYHSGEREMDIQSTEGNTIPLLACVNNCQVSDSHGAKYYGKTSKRRDTFLSGLIKITFYFYQVSTLCKILTGNKSTDTVTSFLKQALINIFNFRTDSEYYHKFLWCPFDDLGSSSKVLLKGSFVLYILVLLLCAHMIICAITTLSEYLNLHSDSSGLTSLLIRIPNALLQIILLGYATLATTFLVLLNCISIGKEKYLYIDASLQCYQNWQYVILSAVILWCIPLPFTLCIASSLLQKGNTLTRHFFISLFLPLPMAVYWAYCYITGSFTILQSDDISKNIKERAIKGQLLHILNGPFHKPDTVHKSNHVITWESVMIGRRLVLMVIHSFVINAVIRLFLMLLFNTIFLIHHVKVFPFSSRALNYMEAGSLLSLCALCVMNLFPAYNYMYPNTYSGHFQSNVDAFEIIETIMLFFIPVVVTSTIFVRILFWILHLMWSAAKFVVVKSAPLEFM